MSGLRPTPSRWNVAGVAGVAGVTIFALLSGRAIAQELPAARAAYAEGQALAGQKRQADAAQKFKLVTTLEPGFAMGWYALALSERRAKNCPGAIPAYRRYAELRPADPEPYFGLGLCHRDTGDRAAALVSLKRFVELERRPEQSKWIDSARGIIATLEAAAAPPAPTTPSARPPTTPTTPTTPTRVAVQASANPVTGTKPTEAPNVAAAAAAYAEAQRLRDSGRIEEALKKFAQVAALDPDLMVARAAWGELLIKIRRDAAAIVVFRAALARNPQYPLICYELAFALRETGKLSEAVEAYQRYIQLRPNDPDPYYGLARTLGRLGRGDEARRTYETYVAMEKRPTEARWVASAEAEIAALKRAGGRPGGATSPSALSGSAPPADRATAPP